MGKVKKTRTKQTADVLDTFVNDIIEDDLVHNRRREEDVDGLAVVPGDAHMRDEALPTHAEGMEEQQILASATTRRAKAVLLDGDFAVPGLDVDAAEVAADIGTGDVTEEIQSVEREFRALTNADRVAMLTEQSPEALRLISDFRVNVAEVKKMVNQLQILAGRRSDRELIAFLETKYQLMLSYCIHICFYLLLKAEGQKVEGHPVIDRLVEIRVYLEKMAPVEQRLQYALSQLMSGKVEGAAPNVKALRPVESGVVNKSRRVDDAGLRAQRKQRREADRAAAIEAEELRNMNRVRGKQAKGSMMDLPEVAPIAEDEDQFLSKFLDGSDSDDGGDLMSLLRRKQEANAKKKKKEESDDDFDDEDAVMDEGDDLDYDDLLVEEQERVVDEEEKPEDTYKDPEVRRRQINQKIQNHRGLTRSRPKDRKNPRVNRRIKARKGENEAAAQTRKIKPEAAGGFAGVSKLKTNVTHSSRLS